MPTDSGIRLEIAEALRLLRVHHGMKQVEFAKAFPASRSYISQLESGEIAYPGIHTIARYSEYFNIPISSIFYIAEHLPRFPAGEVRQSPCSHATRILEIERAKQELHQAKIELANEREQ